MMIVLLSLVKKYLKQKNEKESTILKNWEIKN
jgi:hypothetical protein